MWHCYISELLHLLLCYALCMGVKVKVKLVKICACELFYTERVRRAALNRTSWPQSSSSAGRPRTHWPRWARTWRLWTVWPRDRALDRPPAWCGRTVAVSVWLRIRVVPALFAPRSVGFSAVRSSWSDLSASRQLRNAPSGKLGSFYAFVRPSRRSFFHSYKWNERFSSRFDGRSPKHTRGLTTIYSGPGLPGSLNFSDYSPISISYRYCREYRDCRE